MATNTTTTAICAAGVLAGLIAAAISLRNACSASTPESRRRLAPSLVVTPDGGGGVGCKLGNCGVPPVPPEPTA
ncbi:MULTISPECIES: hypothetical protein [Streptomyces]|uniref:hypothetical protein n=1 Tax=Streptomyces TaxID=1883 RepID=UPI000A685930|nr:MULTISPECIES: hypothetical protein [Streptomyces]